jgi:hypothetical protein
MVWEVPLMNIIIAQPSGTEHVVGDISDDDIDCEEEGTYYAWTDCGIAVTGQWVNTKTKPTTKPCRRCFRNENERTSSDI